MLTAGRPEHGAHVLARRRPSTQCVRERQGALAAHTGAVCALVTMLSRCMCSGRCKTAPSNCRGKTEREVAAGALCNVILGCRETQRAAVRAGCVPRLTALLVAGTPMAVEAAAGALATLSRCSEFRDEIVQCSGVDRLAALLVSGTVRAKAAATRALAPLLKPGDHDCLRASGLSGGAGEVRMPDAMEYPALGITPAPGVIGRRCGARRAHPGAHGAQARGGT